MDLPKARLIARHHLGDTLERVQRGGPHANDWTVKATGPSGMVICTAATVDEAAADCAAQLRESGWTPTHARLEWRSVRWQHFLHFRFDSLDTQVAAASQFGDGTWRLYYRGVAHQIADAENAAAVIAEWHATALPSLHLPTFPGASDAS